MVCHTTGHPVDVASGRLLTSGVDLRLPGPIVLVFKRQYASSWSDRDGPLGWGWSHSFDQAVWVETSKDRGKRDGKDFGTIVYRAEDGREIEFDLVDITKRPAWLQPNERWDRFNRLTLRLVSKTRWEIDGPDGLTREFQVVGAAAGAARTARADEIPGRKDFMRLARIRDRAGNAIALRYDGAGNLDTIIDSGGREIRMENDRAGRLHRVMVSHPTANGWVEHARYVYSASGDLAEVFDPLGHAHRMEYADHLLVRETNRNGLSFFFQYEGSGPEARCVKTWGDGDIYTRELLYDRLNHVTISKDSYGHETTYQMNADNAVVSVRDALGGVITYAFDDAYHKVSEVDPVGGETKWEYDERGNCIKVTGPDGAAAVIEFNDRNQAVHAIDPVKGEWHWGYDQRGLLIARVDPLDRRVRFIWKTDDEMDGARPRVRGSTLAAARRPESAPPFRLAAVIDPAGQTTALGYDRQGNVTSLRSPNAAESRWKYDGLGLCVAASDPKGNTQQRQHDPLNRVVLVKEPDGNVRELEFDAEGNVVHARDQQHDVRFTYQGMGRLRTRTEAGTTVTFEYDREERLIGIKNEKGHVYRFDLGPTGQVVTEIGFDGLRREYKRDAAGRVTKVIRPDRQETTYAYDAGGRLVEAKHSDGTAAAYAYREDGALLEAKNDAGLVTFERDKLGRILKEIVGEDWVASEYDVLGMRVGLRSSKGLRQRFERNGMGDVLAVRARFAGADASADHEAGIPRGGPNGVNSQGGNGGGGDSVWEARFERDTVGLELERALPGGVRARWERDNLGRPKIHSISLGGLSKAAWQYTWEVNDRLLRVVDLMAGPTEYQHDALGNLVAAAYADGRVDLRMPDAVGNLFRTENRKDRKYGPAGQLLRAQNAAGGTTRYGYDPEGNLSKKIEPDGAMWAYHWNGAGMLVKVVRPDGDAIEFAYDALGRRLWKRYRGRTTRWIWDGNVPIHEWVEATVAAEVVTAPPPLSTIVTDEIAARQCRADLNERPAQGPPLDCGTSERPITWLFEPESFAPLAKLVGDSRQSIITDHLGTPTAMYDDAGQEIWSASIDAYGDLHNLKGDRQACPFRWPGQYEDAETGLYYNRFRYYDPGAGQYVSQDPIGLLGGPAVYAYVQDPTRRTDRLGLAGDSCGSTPTVDWDPATGRFRDVESGRFIKNKSVPWPADDGFATRKPDRLVPGQILDRYGKPGGNFLSPEGTPFSERGLPTGYEEGKPYNRYEVVSPYDQAESGPIAPTPQFGSSGGGTQIKTAHSVGELVDMGVLKPL
ncbi:MAG TPA: glycohydrolase toxin TNT-related protein [Polyangia bacterium]|nr:glycohydrolase toxin TNT-related protein [Polyangia bacterium]